MPINRLLVALGVILVALSLAQIAVIAGLREEIALLTERMTSLERSGSRAVPGPAPAHEIARGVAAGDPAPSRSTARAPDSDASPATAAGGTGAPETDPGGMESSETDPARSSLSRADTLRVNHPEPGAATEEQIQKIVEKTLNEKGAHRWMHDGKLKPPMNEYSKELGLTSTQEAEFLRSVNDGKREVFDLLRVPRPDGTSLADDFVDIFKNPPQEQGAAAQKGGEVWLKLFSERVPGRETTYIAEILTIQGKMKSDFQMTLTPEQMQHHLQSGVDPLDIKTGYEPFEEYLAEELKK